MILTERWVSLKSDKAAGPAAITSHRRRVRRHMPASIKPPGASQSPGPGVEELRDVSRSRYMLEISGIGVLQGGQDIGGSFFFEAFDGLAPCRDLVGVRFHGFDFEFRQGDAGDPGFD